MENKTKTTTFQGKGFTEHMKLTGLWPAGTLSSVPVLLWHAAEDEILELLFGYLNFLRGLPAWPQDGGLQNLCAGQSKTAVMAEGAPGREPAALRSCMGKPGDGWAHGSNCPAGGEHAGQGYLKTQDFSSRLSFS